MLQIMPETRKILRTIMLAVDENGRLKISAAKKAPDRQIPKVRFDVLVGKVTEILKTGYPTPFEHEGSCRHGIRSGLCGEGWKWPDADHAAGQVVAKALARTGAKRPTWQQGQPEWTQDGYSPVERVRCAHCGDDLPDDMTNRLYCSPACKQGAYRVRAKATDEKRTKVEWIAAMAAQKAHARKERERDCDQCGKAFTPDLHYKRRRFCSQVCAKDAAKTERRKHADKPCIHCGTMFRPKREESKYCGMKCMGDAKRVAQKRPPKQCECCGTLFQAAVPTRKFCSTACRNNGTRVNPYVTVMAEASKAANALEDDLGLSPRHRASVSRVQSKANRRRAADEYLKPIQGGKA